ncbi:MAG: lytic transglycosylase domain-containing protein [Rhodospirillales bacterium]|nr:lytic transglycosylase domain-containing protein [Rhodospirillales bacterium]
MRVPTRLLPALLALMTTTAVAQDLRDPAENPMAAVRADRWQDAQALAARFADPVTQKLVLYYRLMAPGAATAPEIADFMARNPDWPNQATLERRRQEAIASEPDQAIVLAQCTAKPPSLAGAMLRCAEAFANAGQQDQATATARAAWVQAIGDPAGEAAFLRRWGGVPTAADQWARFQRLAWSDTAAANRQLARVPPQDRAAAEARLALRRDDPRAEALVAALPAADGDDPGMMLDHARSLRRTDHLADATALWLRAGPAAQAAAPAHLTAFWAERNLLARKLLQTGDAAGAYAIAAAHGQTAGEPRADAEFLAGFIALRRLNQPAEAEGHFRRLATASGAAITQGRAWYWIGRAEAAAGKDPTAAYKQAAAWPTTFYGQLAAIALGEDAATLARRIDALRDPAFTPDTAQIFTGHEVVRAALWLVALGEPQRARAFLLRMDELAPVPGERTLTADLALRLGLPDTAVFVARRLGRDGSALPQAGWPTPYTPPGPLDPAVSLSVMRQESSFDIGAVSPSGARGLMQLMPFTAQGVAKKLGIATTLASLTTDPSHNMRLGTSYLQEMLDRFGGALPLAVAAYNAGPHRVDVWLGDNGDPRTGPVAMIDWLELIPIAETRNYVQRVLENVVIYRARLHEDTPTLLAQWTK